MKTVRVGLIGSGFATAVHLQSYKRIYGVNVELAAVATTNEKRDEFARKNGIARAVRDYRELLRDKDIDVVDLCTPPALHASMVVDAVQAGKHVICEKPFTGYFGHPGDPTPIGKKVAKKDMYERTLAEMQHTCEAVRASGKIFMYAENWVYAPAVTKMAEVVAATKDKILFMRGDESHSGSHAAHAAHWNQTGGGSLIRQGCHPLATMLYLKQVEARARGEKISIVSVLADTGNVMDCLRPDERTYIPAKPVDVEDWGTLTVTFSDGTKATLFACDVLLGGVRDFVEALTNGGTMTANISRNTHLLSYMTDEEKLKDIYVTEKVDRKTGWQYVCVDEQWSRGYLQEMQDFMECVATSRQPMAGLDLAFDTIRASYAAYWSAEAGCRVKL